MNVEMMLWAEEDAAEGVNVSNDEQLLSAEVER